MYFPFRIAFLSRVVVRDTSEGGKIDIALSLKNHVIQELTLPAKAMMLDSPTLLPFSSFELYQIHSKQWACPIEPKFSYPNHV